MFLVVSLIAAYAGAALAFARWRYRHTRPYTEPLSCWFPNDRYGVHNHTSSCYWQYGVIDSAGEAAFFAVLLGLIWPLALASFGVAWLVAGADRPLPEEVAARTKRLERELGIGGDS